MKANEDQRLSPEIRALVLEELSEQVRDAGQTTLVALRAAKRVGYELRYADHLWAELEHALWQIEFLLPIISDPEGRGKTYIGNLAAFRAVGVAQ